MPVKLHTVRVTYEAELEISYYALHEICSEQLNKVLPGHQLPRIPMIKAVRDNFLLQNGAKLGLREAMELTDLVIKQEGWI